MKATPKASLWRQAHGNFFDQCVLDWCKLFAERNGKQHWRRLVQDDADGFRQSLLAHLAVGSEQFESYTRKMRAYPDSFVAHLDRKKRMGFPDLDIAHASVLFLHQQSLRCVVSICRDLRIRPKGLLVVLGNAKLRRR